MLIAQFSDATDSDAFTPTEIKRIFYHAMPTRWRTNFINSGQSLQTTSVETLRTYMVQQELQTDAHSWKSRDANNGKKGNKVPFSRFNKHNNKGQRKHTSNKSKQTKERKITRSSLMMMTAPFMAVAINGDSAIKIRTARTFVLAIKVIHLTR